MWIWVLLGIATIATLFFLIAKGTTTSVPSNSLVAKLVSNHEPSFLAGLREAVTRADAGEYEAVQALHEAVRIRSGKADVSFHKPGIVVTQGMDRYMQARAKILALAGKQALLENPKHSGSLITAFAFMSDRDAFRALLDEIYSVGGPSEGYAFQLLFNELRCTARFNVSR